MSSLCGAKTTVESDEEGVDDVFCSLPAGHQEAHQGVYWWTNEPSQPPPAQEQQT